MHCVDLGEGFPTHISLQNLASIQPRMSPVKFARFWTGEGGTSALQMFGNPLLVQNRGHLLQPREIIIGNCDKNCNDELFSGPRQQNRRGREVQRRRALAPLEALRRVGRQHGHFLRPGHLQRFVAEVLQRNGWSRCISKVTDGSTITASSDRLESGRGARSRDDWEAAAALGRRAQGLFARPFLEG